MFMIFRKTVIWDYRVRDGHKQEFLELIRNDAEPDDLEALITTAIYNKNVHSPKGSSFYREGDVLIENFISKDYEKTVFTFGVEVGLPELKCDVERLR